MRGFTLNKHFVPQPRHRSNLRLLCGRIWFRSRRFLSWYLSGIRFAKRRSNINLRYVAMQHGSILLRELRNVDMWLQHNKITNLNIAVSHIDGLILEPGEVFSYWRLIGNPSARRGFKTGMILFNGEIRQGIGGGLCQLSNLLYWMTIHTSLTVTERWRHSFDVFPDSVRTQPFGSGATCAYNHIDLQIANNTPDIYQLRLWLDEKYLYGEWRVDIEPVFKYEIEEREHLIQLEVWGGYSRHNKIFRKKFYIETSELIDEEFVTENHAMMMYQPLLPPQSASDEQLTA